MKVLWITNCLFEEYFATKCRHAAFTGGWMRSLALKLLETDSSIEIAVASLLPDVKELEEIKAGPFTFFALPGSLRFGKYDSSIEPLWREVHRRFNPDVVHIHGSEFYHGLAYRNTIDDSPVVVSIQGMVSRIARYHTLNGNNHALYKFLTIGDLLTLSMPNKGQRSYRRQGRYEEELLRKVNHIIGRTAWDRDNTWAINPDARYHFCNETLRPEFYSCPPWSVAECQPHRIFLSQAASPIKGIHNIVEALPLILRHYPDAEVYVAGVNFTDNDGIRNKLRLGAYGNYIRHRIKHLGIASKIHFTGPLSAENMVEQYRKANVFICPSSIENSPNSLGEAQLVGCPVVASYVGGVPDMVENERTGLLYRYEEIEMLAAAVCRIFADSDLAGRLSSEERTTAFQRHDGNVNACRMLEIYNEVANS